MNQSPTSVATAPRTVEVAPGLGLGTLPQDRQWRPHGKGLLPVLPDDDIYAWIEQHTFDTRSGAPPAVERFWGLRRTSESHATAWHILLLMAATGLNLQWDILDAEQDRMPFTARQVAQGAKAPRQDNALRILRRQDCLDGHHTRTGNVHCVWLRLTARARDLLADVGIEAVESDWDRMLPHHDPQGNQTRHTVHCLTAARLARGRGWEARLAPEEQPLVDLRLTPPGRAPIYVECEARAPSRSVRRIRKWERLSALQGFAAVIATRPQGLRDLADEIRLTYRLPCAGADLETLIASPESNFWSTDDREPPC